VLELIFLRSTTNTDKYDFKRGKVWRLSGSKNADNIYKEQGEVQFDILPTVRVAKDIFKRNNCINIMDLGCGTGRHSIYLAQQGFKVYATDISETGLEITKLKAEKLNLDNIKFKKHDMRDITFETNSLDGILCGVDNRAWVIRGFS